MATVRFYGDLQRYGRKFKLEVYTAGEALKALMIQIPGLRQHIQNGEYRVRIAGKDMHQDNLNTGMQSQLPDDAVIHLIPHLAGAKNGGVFSLIAGIAIIIVAWWNPAGWISAGAVSGMYAAGAGMALSGITMLLTKMPPTLSIKGSDLNSNTAFSNLDNTVTQGQPIPVCYGEMMIGSKVLSQGVTTE